MSPGQRPWSKTTASNLYQLFRPGSSAIGVGAGKEPAWTRPTFAHARRVTEDPRRRVVAPICARFLWRPLRAADKANRLDAACLLFSVASKSRVFRMATGLPAQLATENGPLSSDD